MEGRRRTLHLGALDGRGPVYRQLYRRFRAAILGGQLPPGAKLPPTRSVAEELGLSRGRVVLAYQQLLDEGYAAGRVGSGTYVAEALPDPAGASAGARGGDGRQVARGEGAREADAAPPAPRLSRVGEALLARGPTWPGRTARLRYDFRYGQPSFRDFPHSVWAKLVRRHARSTTPEALDYAHAAGLPALREAIAAFLVRWRGLDCTPEQVVVTTGSQQALALAATLLADPGDPVALEEPHYPGARQAFEAVGARLVPVRVDDEGLDVAHLAALRPAPRLVCVTPSHQFPSGAVLPLRRRLELLAWAEETGALVLEDDYDGEYRYAGPPLDTLQSLDRTGRVLYLGTFSKILFPALRVGYLVVPRALARPFARARAAADLGGPRLLQAVLADFLAEGHLESHLRRSRRRHAARRRALVGALDRELGPRVRIRGADAGLHIVLELPGARPARAAEVATRGRACEVGVYPTDPFHLQLPARAELLLGHGSLDADEIRTGVARLAETMGP